MIRKYIIIALLGITIIAFSNVHFLTDNEVLTFVSLSLFSFMSALLLQKVNIKFYKKILLFSSFNILLFSLNSFQDGRLLYFLFHLHSTVAILLMFSLGSFVNFNKYRSRSIILIVLAVIFISAQFVYTNKIIYHLHNVKLNEQAEKIPNFEITDLDGNKITQNDFKGKIVFFDFWAVTCGQCIKQFPSIDIIRNKFKDNPNVEFYLINYDGPKDDIDYVKKFIKQREIKIPVLFDANTKFATDMNCFAFPHSFIIDKNLNIRYHHTGYQKAAEDIYIKEVTNLIKKILDE